LSCSSARKRTSSAAIDASVPGVCVGFSRINCKSVSKDSDNTTHSSGWMIQAQPTRTSLGGSVPNPTHGSGWMIQAQPTRTVSATQFRIPPTAVGGSFKPSLQEQSRRLSSESHPRQWVDDSSPAYKNSLGDSVPNPTHGSGWIVQAQPTRTVSATQFRIPTHGSGLIVQAQPTRTVSATQFRIPTHGSGLIIRAQPTHDGGPVPALPLPLSPRGAKGERNKQRTAARLVGWT